jgi:hypothetical protein
MKSTFACCAQLGPLFRKFPALNGGLTKAKSELKRTLVLPRILVQGLGKQGRIRIDILLGRVFANMAEFRECPGPQSVGAGRTDAYER